MIRSVDEVYGGVETGGTWTVCALGRDPDNVVAYEEFPTTTPDETIDRILRFFSERPPARAIGIGSFGPVDLKPDSETWGFLTTTPKPGWAHTPLGGVVSERLGVPVAFDLDVAAAAIGEQRWGAGRGAELACYLTVGTGIGAGLVRDGEAWHGLIHPEVGHLRIPHDRAEDPFDGSCPVHGDCWEGLASGDALAARWGCKASDLADDHPAWALEARYLALGILSIVMIASPHRMIVGGGVMLRKFLMDMVRRELRELVGGYLDTPLLGEEIDSYVVAPELGDRAGVLGAIAMAQRLTGGAS